MNVTLKKIISWVLVFIWLVVIFMFSSMNSSESNNKSEKTIGKALETTITTTNNLGITNKHPSNTRLIEYSLKLNLPLRKCMHAFVYFVLSLLILNALKISEVKNKKMYIIALIVCFLYSLFDEYHQTFVNGRNGQILDSLIDTSGSTVGIMFYYLFNKIIKKRRNSTYFV